MFQGPRPPRKPRMDEIAAQAAMQGVGMKQGPVPFLDTTPWMKYGPLKPAKEGQPAPVYLITSEGESIYAPAFIIMRPFGHILFSEEEGLRPFDQRQLTVEAKSTSGESSVYTVACRADVTELIWGGSVKIRVVPGEEWMQVTEADKDEISAYMGKRLAEGESELSLRAFLAERAHSSENSAGIPEGGEDES